MAKSQHNVWQKAVFFSFFAVTENRLVLPSQHKVLSGFPYALFLEAAAAILKNSFFPGCGRQNENGVNIHKNFPPFILLP